MAIESKAKIKGFPSLIPGVYSRVVSANIDTQKTKVTIQVKDWASKEAAKKVFDTLKRPVVTEYDPENPDHVERYEAMFPDVETRPDPMVLDAHGKRRQFLDYEEYQEWDGQKTEEPAIGDRTIVLPLELALAVAQMAVPGANPGKQIDDMASQLYRAAMLTGEFIDAVAV
jgi:hypothetical protein